MASNGLKFSAGFPPLTGRTNTPSTNRSETPSRRTVNVKVPPKYLEQAPMNAAALNNRFPSLLKLDFPNLSGMSGILSATRGNLRLVSSPEPMSEDDFQPSLKFDSNTNIDEVYFLPPPEFTGLASIQLSIDPLRDDETRQSCQLEANLEIKNGDVVNNEDAEFQVVQPFQA